MAVHDLRGAEFPRARLAGVVLGDLPLHGEFLRHMVALAGDEGGAEGAHDAGNVRTDDIGVQKFLEGAQNRVVIECTALDDDVLSEILGAGDLDDLI